MFRGNRGRRRGGRRGGRLPAPQRHALSVTCERYIPPPRPLPRQDLPRFRVVRIYDGTPDAATHQWTPYSVAFFVGSLSGFSQMYVHRIAVWTENQAQATGKAQYPELGLKYCRPNDGQVCSPQYNAKAGAYNENACVGMHVPSHLSGPWLKSEEHAVVYISVNDIVNSLSIEIDATYC